MVKWRMASFLAVIMLIPAVFVSANMMVSRAMAMGAAPGQKPKIDCRKKKNKDKTECFCKVEQNKGEPRCQQQGSLNDDQFYQAGYWLAQNGKYQEAIAQLKLASNQKDPRILNYIGYSTRKLGHIDKALDYYRKALSVNPDYTLARAYMAEAFLEQRRLDLAREQLVEIEKRCGISCVEFSELSSQIKSFEETGKFSSQGKIDTSINH